MLPGSKRASSPRDPAAAAAAPAALATAAAGFVVARGFAAVGVLVRFLGDRLRFGAGAASALRPALRARRDGDCSWPARPRGLVRDGGVSPRLRPRPARSRGLCGLRSFGRRVRRALPGTARGVRAGALSLSGSRSGSLGSGPASSAAASSGEHRLDDTVGRDRREWRRAAALDAVLLAEGSHRLGRGLELVRDPGVRRALVSPRANAVELRLEGGEASGHAKDPMRSPRRRSRPWPEPALSRTANAPAREPRSRSRPPP